MTSEEIKAAELAKAEAEKAQKEKADADANLSDEEKEANAKKEEAKVDYEVLLNKEKERNAILQKEIADKAFKLREKKRDEEEDEGDDDDDDKPITKRELTSILSNHQESLSKQLLSDRALEVARKYTSSDAEALATVEYYKNRVKSTGNIEEDILFAVGGLNAKKIIAQNAELKRALLNKEHVNKDGSSTYREDTPSSESKLSTNDAVAYKQAGYTWDGIKKCYKKPLNGGKQFLYKDPKSKRSWVE